MLNEANLKRAKIPSANKRRPPTKNKWSTLQNEVSSPASDWKNPTLNKPAPPQPPPQPQPQPWPLHQSQASFGVFKDMKQFENATTSQQHFPDDGNGDEVIDRRCNDYQREWSESTDTIEEPGDDDESVEDYYEAREGNANNESRNGLYGSNSTWRQTKGEVFVATMDGAVLGDDGSYPCGELLNKNNERDPEGSISIDDGLIGDDRYADSLDAMQRYHVVDDLLNLHDAGIRDPTATATKTKSNKQKKEKEKKSKEDKKKEKKEKKKEKKSKRNQSNLASNGNSRKTRASANTGADAGANTSTGGNESENDNERDSNNESESANENVVKGKSRGFFGCLGSSSGTKRKKRNAKPTIQEREIERLKRENRQLQDDKEEQRQEIAVLQNKAERLQRELVVANGKNADTTTAVGTFGIPGTPGTPGTSGTLRKPFQVISLDSKEGKEFLAQMKESELARKLHHPSHGRVCATCNQIITVPKWARVLGLPQCETDYKLELKNVKRLGARNRWSRKNRTNAKRNVKRVLDVQQSRSQLHPWNVPSSIDGHEVARASAPDSQEVTVGLDDYEDEEGGGHEADDEQTPMKSRGSKDNSDPTLVTTLLFNS